MRSTIFSMSFFDFQDGTFVRCSAAWWYTLCLHAVLFSFLSSARQDEERQGGKRRHQQKPVEANAEDVGDEPVGVAAHVLAVIRQQKQRQIAERVRGAG